MMGTIFFSTSCAINHGRMFNKMLTNLGAQHIVRSHTYLTRIIELPPAQPLHFVLQYHTIPLSAPHPALTSRLPLSSMKAGDLPPSSRVQGVRCLLAAALEINSADTSCLYIIPTQQSCPPWYCLCRRCSQTSPSVTL